jgi:hypothetical protein
MEIRKLKRCRAASPNAAIFSRLAGSGDPALQFSDCITPAQMKRLSLSNLPMRSSPVMARDEFDLSLIDKLINTNVNQ